MTIDAMKLSAKEFADSIKKIDSTDRREYLRRRDERDLRKLGFSEHDIAKTRAWAALSPEDRAKLTQIDDAAKAEAKRQFKAEREKFLDEQRKRFGTDL